MSTETVLRPASRVAGEDAAPTAAGTAALRNKFLGGCVSSIANGFRRGSSNLLDGDRAMKTTQGWGWLAAGVLALGLNGVYHDGGAAWAHRVVDLFADRSGVLADLASEKVDQLMGSVDPAAARDETTSCKLAAAVARFHTKMARTQTGLARFEAVSARQEAALSRVEAGRARIEAEVAGVRLAPAAFSTVEFPVDACPRVRANIPRVDVPAVRVEMGTGPI